MLDNIMIALCAVGFVVSCSVMAWYDSEMKRAYKKFTRNIKGGKSNG